MFYKAKKVKVRVEKGWKKERIGRNIGNREKDKEKSREK